MKKIMFVCHGNICRSPMAEYIMKDIVTKNHKDKDYLIASSATSYEEIGNDIYPPAKKVLRDHHISFDRHEAHRLTKNEYDEYDYIIVMEHYNVRNLLSITNDVSKVSLLGSYSQIGEISDPWYSGKFNQCYDEIKKSCEKLYDYLEGQNA